MRPNRKLAAPFVMTVATLALPSAMSACGGSTNSDSGGAGGAGGGKGGTSGSGATGGTSATGGTGATGGIGASGGTGGGASCPPTPPSTGSYGTCSPVGIACVYDVTCHSGPSQSTYSCDGTAWSLAPASCAYPDDECSDGKHCTAGTWQPPPDPNYNPPGPCPTTAPTAGATCQPGGFGGDPPACGYPCDADGGPGWFVAHCDYPLDGGTQTWQLDACQ
jgi:hypothetical protein